MSIATQTSQLLTIDPAEFRQKFNQTGFMIGHRLAEHELFTLPRLVELSKRLPPARVEYNAGNLDVGHGRNETPMTGLSIEDTIERIETCNSWMVLKNIELDPEYKQLLDDCLREVAQHSEPLAPGMHERVAFIFVSSPGSVTPYHIDHENNFLMQIRGRKQVRMFNRFDRTVLSNADIERVFSGGPRNLDFADQYLERSQEFLMQPGDGLHFPVHAPHFVKVADNVSISFSITFQTIESERLRTLHLMNHKLRKLKITPSAPGTSAWRDEMKIRTYGTIRSVKRLMFGRR